MQRGITAACVPHNVVRRWLCLQATPGRKSGLSLFRESTGMRRRVFA
jgi:hypothetical protein